MNTGKHKGDHNSNYRGVYLHKPTGRWLAQIRLAEGKKHPGYFDNEEERPSRFDMAATEGCGEFEQLNLAWESCPCDELEPEIGHRPHRGSVRVSRCKASGASAKRTRSRRPV